MDPDTLAAACHILASEWGSYGYRIEAVSPTYDGGALHVVHTDGSRFILAVDRYACHHAHAEHQGYEPSTRVARAAAVANVRAAHEAAQRRRPNALDLCNACNANAADPDSAAGYCAECQAETP